MSLPSSGLLDLNPNRPLGNQRGINFPQETRKASATEQERSAVNKRQESHLGASFRIKRRASEDVDNRSISLKCTARVALVSTRLGGFAEAR
jgi:hypothetical protein